MSIFCYILLFLLTSIGVINAQQDSVVVRDNQIVIIINGRICNSGGGRYIYRNDVDTAYALVIGHYYSQEEVERALGKPDSIQNRIEKLGTFCEGNINFFYNNLFLKIDYNTGLCEIRNKNPNITFNFSGVPIKLGESYKFFEEKYPSPLIMKEQTPRSTDDTTGLIQTNWLFNYTGDDDWLILNLLLKTEGGIELIYNGFQYLQHN
ncbi:MAG: hypothetical protein IJY36_03450 [Coprobacter sp.]|nr:hypothetical protein [Coprobacter sp.]